MNIKSQKANNGILNLKFSLNKNGICLIEINELQDQASTYPGLDDSKITGY